jgi:hypothetical protein
LAVSVNFGDPAVSGRVYSPQDEKVYWGKKWFWVCNEENLLNRI